MINKNFYRKTNDKKILHKVGKQWKVISVALLMAVAGGAVAATHANANADANTNAVDNTVTRLNSSAVANPPRYAAPSSTVSSSANKSVASSAIHYYTDANNGFSGYNGIAASYFDQVSDENKVVQKNYNTVNSYVQSLNAEYNPQMHSYGVKINSASDAAKNDSKLAKSYSATTRNNATFATINSLAAKNSLDPTTYQGAVENNERYYSNAVSGASADVKAASDVNSLVSKLEGTNLSSASLQASVASGIAHSNLNGANSVLASLHARYNVDTPDNADTASLATKLAADAEVLSAAGNEIGNNADYQSLMNNNKTDAPAQNSLTNDINKAVSNAVASASSNISTDLSSLNSNAYSTDLHNIAELANASDYFLGNVSDENGVALSGANNADPLFKGAVSAATNYSLAGVLSNAADEILGHGNAAYNTAYAESVAGSQAIASASAKALNASYASDYTSANSSVINTISLAVGRGNGSNSNDLASYAVSALADGLTGYEQSLHLVHVDNGSAPTYNFDYSKMSTYLESKVNSNDQKLVTDLLANVPTNDQNNFGKVQTYLFNAKGVLNNLTFGKDSKKVGANNSLDSIINSNANYTGGNIESSQKNQINGILSPVIKDVLPNFGNDTTMGDLTAATHKVYDVFSNLSTQLNDIGNDQNNNVSDKIDHPYTVTPKNGALRAALLSDGVDIDQLEAESDAIANVNNTASSAVASASTSEGRNFNKASYAENLANALSVAASSANSALDSADTASANYSAANDEDVTLASYFASSYTNEANSESASAVDLNNSLSSYLVSMAGDDSTFASADSNFNSANYAAANDYKLGVGYAQAIYNSHAHFLDVLKNAKLHSTPDFGSKNYNDKVVGSVNKGDRLTVLGVNVSRNNDWRGVVRYAVVDNSNGKKGFITGQPAYTKAAYLSAIAAHSDVEVKTLKPVNVYAQENGKKVLKTISAGQVLHNADVVYDSAEEDAYGFTKVQLSDGNFITANTDYVEILNPTVNTPTNNTPSEFGFNLNGGQNMAPYYNNLTQN